MRRVPLAEPRRRRATSAGAASRAGPTAAGRPPVHRIRTPAGVRTELARRPTPRPGLPAARPVRGWRAEIPAAATAGETAPLARWPRGSPPGAHSPTASGRSSGSFRCAKSNVNFGTATTPARPRHPRGHPTAPERTRAACAPRPRCERRPRGCRAPCSARRAVPRRRRTRRAVQAVPESLNTRVGRGALDHAEPRRDGMLHRLADGDAGHVQPLPRGSLQHQAVRPQARERHPRQPRPLPRLADKSGQILPGPFTLFVDARLQLQHGLPGVATSRRRTPASARGWRTR